MCSGLGAQPVAAAHKILCRHQKALEDNDLRGYARDAVLARVRRDVGSGVESGQVAGTPTLFINGVLYAGGYDAGTISRVLAT